MRLDKYLADAGLGTRSEVKKWIKSGRITINGSPAGRPEQKVDPSADAVCADGEPAGCVTARSDASLPTVMDYFPASMREKFSPVGRLDKDTEGLLLVTNDGALNHRLTSPAYHVDKTYFARLDAPVPREAVSLFAAGVDIGDDKPTLPAQLVLLSDEREAELTIREGRFHQVKRMFEAVGCTVIYLKRLSMGGLTLGDLPRGEYRKLSPEEIEHEV
jgi:16S rRNA pseudouridine516 synthase